jgi:dipeptidyl aminopeptidase/acylaminoacyl peptidase
MSGGDYVNYSLEEELNDIQTALAFLADQNAVNADRLALIGHSLGGYYALKTALRHESVKACIVMAMPFYADYLEAARGSLRYMAEVAGWDSGYVKLAMQSVIETFDMVKKSSLNWSLILGKRCYMKRTRENIYERPLETIKDVKIPVLLLHGNKDRVVAPERSKQLDDYLEAIGNDHHRLIYFGYLGHFFGEVVFDGKTKMRYAVDPHVLEAITLWLNDTLTKIEAEQKEAPLVEVTEDEHP